MRKNKRKKNKEFESSFFFASAIYFAHGFKPKKGRRVVVG